MLVFQAGVIREVWGNFWRKQSVTPEDSDWELQVSSHLLWLGWLLVPTWVKSMTTYQPFPRTCDQLQLSCSNTTSIYPWSLNSFTHALCTLQSLLSFIRVILLCFHTSLSIAHSLYHHHKSRSLQLLSWTASPKHWNIILINYHTYHSLPSLYP